MSRPWTTVVLAVAAAGALVAGGAAVQIVRDRAYPRPVINDATLYLTSGKALRRMAVGYTALLADVYWIRAIQHVGDGRLGRTPASEGRPADHPPLLHVLLDLTTTLDPHFNIAYRFGSIFLAEPPPGGAGRPDLAIALLQKGLRDLPDTWEYAMDIGFVHYWWLHDYRSAAGWFDRASQMPDAPWWLDSMAATTLAQGGDRVSSRRMWESIRESADNDWLRGSAQRALLQLRALDEIDELQVILERAATQGRVQLGASRVIQLNGRVALDPTGVPYEIDATGRVRLGQKSSLFPLPVDSAGRAS